MNIQTEISKNVKEAPVALEAYGFTMPLMNGGHRIWPPQHDRVGWHWHDYDLQMG